MTTKTEHTNAYNGGRGACTMLRKNECEQKIGLNKRRHYTYHMPLTVILSLKYKLPSVQFRMQSNKGLFK